MAHSLPQEMPAVPKSRAALQGPRLPEASSRWVSSATSRSSAIRKSMVKTPAQEPAEKGVTMLFTAEDDRVGMRYTSAELNNGRGGEGVKTLCQE